MAVTIAISFVPGDPIEAIVWLLALPSGVMIGYYANARSDRRNGPWHRILTNALFAGAVTGLTMALILLGTKALFFYADRLPGLQPCRQDRSPSRPVARRAPRACTRATWPPGARRRWPQPA